MPNNRTHITGILLAGGMSQRMGSEKGSIRIGNSYLYKYPLAVLEKVCDEILISTCNDSLFQEKYPRICDEVKGIGPMGGIYSCLKRSSNEINLVLSYDMPLLNPSLFKLLISESMGYHIVLPALGEGRPQPGCGMYSRSAAGLMEEMIARKDFALNHMLKHSKSRIVRITKDMDCWRPDLFLNINSKEDLKHIPSTFGE